MGLTLCNAYPTRIVTAIMFYSPGKCGGGDGGNFQTMGWWPLEPGSCALVYANDLEKLNQYWYYFARADDGAVWAGPYGASVPLSAFDSCYKSAVEPGLTIGYRELDIGTNADYTLTFA